ncbi:hypothetical protein CBE89_08500 [Corynebacterium striatum]|uniref:Uncharacterized protein n=1 Tax=Corynebacterium striatum TaxID=43770 RepID=A0A2Z2J8K7_CORST|nr:hypothetical protein [Corynebacterium striatum]ART21538.1 hypothetical protein CBE89_08500 [Corynebacterium striatum]
MRALHRDAGETILGRLVAKELSNIADATASVQQYEINHAADLIVGAREAYVCGRGNSIPVADQMLRRLR